MNNIAPNTEKQTSAKLGEPDFAVGYGERVGTLLVDDPRANIDATKRKRNIKIKIFERKMISKN